MRTYAGVVVFAVLTLSGCAAWYGRDEASAEFDKETSADDVRVLEDKARAALGRIETALADYDKAEKGVPDRLDKLVPKYLAEIPTLDIPACGGETDKVQYYPADVLRDGQVDGTRLIGRGRWGYVHNSQRVIVFVDCLKRSSKGVPWYQERGVY